jgi:hypothetical protein
MKNDTLFFMNDTRRIIHKEQCIVLTNGLLSGNMDRDKGQEEVSKATL